MTQTITSQDYTDWLSAHDKHRIILVEATYDIGSGPQIEYISNSSFISKSHDSTPNQGFADVITRVPTFTADISGRSSIGELECVNDGSLDEWITRAWQGHPLKVYFGDFSWAFDDFRLIFNGVNGGIKARRHDRVSFTFESSGKVFDVNLQSDLITGTEEPTPIALGEVFNAEPRLLDSATHLYQVHEGVCTVVDVRDNGLSVAYTDNGNGTFTLNAQPFGRITCDVSQADNTVSLQTRYIANKIGYTDIDPSVDNFPNTSTTGVYFRKTTSARKALNSVIRGVGGFFYFNQLSELVIRRFEEPSNDPVLEIIADDIVENNIRLTNEERPFTQITVLYNRNNTVQDADGLAGALNDDDRRSYSTEWGIVTANNTIPEYPIAEEQDDIETVLTLVSNAQAEADRRAALRDRKRLTYGFTAYASPFSLRVGDTVSVTNQRLWLTNGRNLTVVKIRVNPAVTRVDLEVWG